MITGDRPIGYWLRHLDQLITQSFDRTLQVDGLSRRHWQILTVLSGQPADLTALAVALAPFAVADPAEIPVAVDDLTGRGWLSVVDDGTFELTPAGRQAHQRLLERVEQGRRVAADGVGEADFRTAMAVLRRMSDNLEAARSNQDVTS